ncbi:DMT family transporter [Antrihabitans sp. YC2-6]|uniref:DMT family transporter n=1 Tax=Antrihabitans sp. YC2-6 TaxID=2799498 RepID=UPI0027DBAED8|nr:DMT family transporter [Antrihabitans sp. YC2-6]
MIAQRRHRIGVLAAIAVGMSVSGQARINGALGHALDDGVAAAALSFGLGLVLLSIGLAASARMRAQLSAVRVALRTRTLAPWQCLGGLCGAFYVACQGITIALIGVAVFTVAVVGGQLLSSLWVDRAGIGPGAPSPVTSNRIFGAVLALVAVAIASSGRFDAGWSAIGWAILPAVAGVGLAWQQAVNGRVAAASGPMMATWVNFVVGTAALLAILVGKGLVADFPDDLPTEPWLYVGGALGVAHIAAAAVVVRWIGVLLLGLGAIAGQLLGAVALDLLAPAGAGLSATVLAGSVLTLVAVAIASVSRRPIGTPK